MNEQASSWLNAIDGLPAVHARLQRVVILNQPALEVLRSQDGPSSCFYCDPPYLPDTRTSKKAFGPFEMTVEQHEELLDAITGLAGHGDDLWLCLGALRFSAGRLGPPRV